MTEKEKRALITLISEFINNLPTTDEVSTPSEPKATDEKPQLLTIKECTEEISGLSENTLRQLIAKGRIAHFRSGAGKRGKILVFRNSLINFFNN